MNVTLHFQSTGMLPRNGQPFSMRGTSLTVGRSDQNDIVLPDPDRVISGRHCAIEDQGGNVVAIDFSTNGTFLNYGKMALGATPTPINDGDILSIGAYELMVQIILDQAQDPMQNIASPLANNDFSVGSANAAGAVMDVLDDRDDFLDDLLGGPTSGPSGVVRDKLGDDGLMPPLEDNFGLIIPDEDVGDDFSRAQASHSSPMSDFMQTPAPATSTIPDDWDLAVPEVPTSLIATVPARSIDQFLEIDEVDARDIIPDYLHGIEPIEVPVEVAPVVRKHIEQAPVSASVTMSSGGPEHAARAFLKALGADGLNISDQELEPTLTRLGHVMRIIIHGVREILMTRASIKSEFRIHQTVISAGKNNPLKFSASAEQAVESMVKPTSKGYLDAHEAAEEALKDIKAHEVAMMTGMEAALKGVLVKLEPATLAKTIEADSGFKAALTNKKARYWDTFEKKYEEIADQVENDFHDLFSKEFARAYQEQLEKLK